MAREVKIKIKNEDGKFELEPIPLPPTENLNSQLKNLAVKFPDDAAKRIEMIREIREYELITPLFGGGVTTKKADEVSVIRATEIRGHLRFWWRATRGGQFATIEDLKKHEDAIFGSTETDSALQIEVEIIRSGNPFPNQKDNKNQFQPIESPKSPFSYVAFPLRDEKGAKLIENIVFKVIFTYPKVFNNEIKAALWGWEMYGGVGARTRRGFGAIQNKKYLPSWQNLATDFEKGFSEYLLPCIGSKSFPILSQTYKFTAKQTDPIAAWKYLFDKLKSFRQYRKDKFGNPSPFGSSQWSEPNALRYRMSRRNKPEIDKFPRAQFGLPILFEMKHDHFKTTLKGKKDDEIIERLSSPLIIRPMKCSDGAVGIALILNTPKIPPNGLVLTDVNKNDNVSGELTSTEAEILSEKLELLENNPNVLEAFLNTL